jgi:hypothetical protein
LVAHFEWNAWVVLAALVAARIDGVVRLCARGFLASKRRHCGELIVLWSVVSRQREIVVNGADKIFVPVWDRRSV